MPVVSKTQGYYLGEPYLKVVKCGSDGEFTINTPQSIEAALKIREVKAKSLGDANAKLRKLMDEYEARSTTTKRVIVFDFNAKVHIIKNDMCVFSRQDMHFADGLCLSISAAVYDERVTITGGMDQKEVVEYMLVESSIPSSLEGEKPSGFHGRARNQIPWSAEAEDLFKRIGLGLESVILELDKVGTPEGVKGVIEAGGFKLLGNGK